MFCVCTLCILWILMEKQKVFSSHSCPSHVFYYFIKSSHKQVWCDSSPHLWPKKSPLRSSFPVPTNHHMDFIYSFSNNAQKTWLHLRDRLTSSAILQAQFSVLRWRDALYQVLRSTMPIAILYKPNPIRKPTRNKFCHMICGHSHPESTQHQNGQADVKRNS